MSRWIVVTLALAVVAPSSSFAQAPAPANQGAQAATPAGGSPAAGAPAAATPAPTTPSATASATKPAATVPVTGTPAAGVAPKATPPPNLPAGVAPPAGYVIGPEDVLEVVFWREKEMNAGMAVRPDGKISLPLINDVQAAGLTPDQLRLAIFEAAGKFVEDATVTVVIKQINSRRVYVMGQGIGKQGPYALSGPTTVSQMLATAGGVNEYAKRKEIKVIRTENGKSVNLPFNYEDFLKGTAKSLSQNIELKPGDTIIVP